MKTVLILFSVLVILAVIGVAVGAPSGEPVGREAWPVMADISEQGMLAGHQPMMEQMRASALPQMEYLMANDAMRTDLDPEMIRLMEEDQAQIDRMLARR